MAVATATQDDEYASYKLLRAELEKRGYSFREYLLADEAVIEFTSPSNKVWLTRPDRIGYPLNYGFMKEITRNKSLSHVFAERLGVSVAFTRTVVKNESLDEEEVQALLERYTRLVVKPEQASLSNGVSLNLHTVSQVYKAIEHARKFRLLSPNVLIQEQVEGEEVRMVVLEGRCVAALLRRTARVTGDGTHSLAELIALENISREEITGSMVVYPKLDARIIDPEYVSSDQIPKVDKVIELNRSTMIMGGASVYNVMDEIHESYIHTAEEIAQKLGAGFIVVDMMIQNFKSAQTPANMRFNEINNAPVLKLFYSCRDGKNYDIVPQLADAIDRRINI